MTLHPEFCSMAGAILFTFCSQDLRGGASTSVLELPGNPFRTVASASTAAGVSGDAEATDLQGLSALPQPATKRYDSHGAPPAHSVGMHARRRTAGRLAAASAEKGGDPKSMNHLRSQLLRRLEGR